MDVVIIGAGNVAHCFSHLLRLNGHNIKQVLSRNPEHARELAEKLNTVHASDFADIDYDADVYLLAVKDSAIADIADNLRLGRRLIAHTAGAIALDALEKVSSNYGVIYPLQTIRKDDLGDKKIPLLIEGNQATVVNRLKALAGAISDVIIEMDSAQRLKMHVAAVFSNNFPNFLITLCKKYCSEESLDFQLLHPLLAATFEQMTHSLAETRQTGPARRGDVETMAKHVEVLKDHPDLQALYHQLSESIQRYYNV